MKTLIASICLGFVLLACQQVRQAEQIASTSEPLILDSLLFIQNEQDLIAKFGKENVARDTTYLPEGMGTYLVTLLFPGSNKEVSFEWNDTVNFSGLNTVNIYRSGNLWKTGEGITVGTSVSDLVVLNKGHIEFSGLEWDYGGLVSWNNGELQNRGIRVILRLPDQYNNTLNIDSLLGDQIISSKSKIAMQVNPVAGKVSMIRQLE